MRRHIGRLVVGVVIAVVASGAFVYASGGANEAICAVYEPGSWMWYWFGCFLF